MLLEICFKQNIIISIKHIFSALSSSLIDFRCFEICLNFVLIADAKGSKERKVGKKRKIDKDYVMIFIYLAFNSH